MSAFDPCPGYPGCDDDLDDVAAFHAWSRALSFALGRSSGQRARYTIRYRRRHWIVEKVGGGL